MATVKPKSFKSLDKEELYRSAVEDFALPVEAGDNKDTLLAAFLEGGVDWNDYVEQHPECGPDPAEQAEEELKSEVRAGSVITSQAPKVGLSVDEVESVDPESKWADDERNEQNLEEPRVLVKEPTVYAPTDKLLIKMVRDNPLFEVRGYRFTSAHPYALVDAENAQHILEVEDGFRQAFPNELQEFYG